MSPDMLTLVAAVLVYDRAYDPDVDWGDGRFWFPPFPPLSRYARSETRVENDIAYVERYETEVRRCYGIELQIRGAMTDSVRRSTTVNGRTSTCTDLVGCVLKGVSRNLKCFGMTNCTRLTNLLSGSADWSVVHAKWKGNLQPYHLSFLILNLHQTTWDMPWEKTFCAQMQYLITSQCQTM